ncbi:4Fe-4S binding protein [Thermoleophilia bacterium SCSIO 60948]|nr:4Fe-4S binding protein [Thermoleophilia bacterium SCSIO 60948]
MTHVVTQSCVGDGSCVYACPVNCIQPTPDDPRFELAEMLHIDPEACVDCGACVSACPVEAIKPHSRLDERELAFEAINADYHRSRDPRPALAPVPAPLVVRDRGERLSVAIVGSGPAAMYAADEILTIPGARVRVYERRQTPYGLVRTGIAPDHRRTRRLTRQLDRIAAHPRLSMHLGVEIGRDVDEADLLRENHAVIYAVGAASDRPLDLPGADLPGVAGATSFVGWYNGDPDHHGRTFDLSHRRAVVIGNGNVALDVARILSVDPESLSETDIARPALDALRASAIEEVVVVGRRGPSESAFTLPELVGLAATPGIVVRTEQHDLDAPAAGGPKLDLLRGLTARTGEGRAITLRYLRSPVRIEGRGRAERVELAVNEPAPGRPGAVRATGARETIEAGLVLSAIGLRGREVAGLPFDQSSGAVPNQRGRVELGGEREGVYVTGWMKRGPSGFIGSNKACARETVETLVEDFGSGRLGSRPSRAASPSRRWLDPSVR